MRKEVEDSGKHSGGSRGAYYGLVALLAAVPVFAHHSFSMFKPTTMTLSGTVKSFQWTNPHIFVELLVTDPSTKQVAEWSIEGGAVSMLYRQGWKYDSLKPGDNATVWIRPLKNGADGGSLMKVCVNGKCLGKVFGARPAVPPG